MNRNVTNATGEDTVRKFLTIILGLIVCDAAIAAEIVGSEILLCDNGYSPDNQTCETYTVGECGAGFYDVGLGSTTFVSPTDSYCSYTSYKAYSLPDNIIEMMYHGAVLGDEITLCNGGYSTDNSTCTSYSAGDCTTGYHEIETNETTFLAASNGRCSYASYKARTMPDAYTTLEYHGAVMGDEINLCDGGYSTDNKTCTQYATGDECPANYYDVVTNGATFAARDNGACPSGYRQYVAMESCGYNPSELTCVSLCSDGKLTTGVGTCADLCPLGITVLRSSNGVVVPLWSSSQTTPALNVGYNDGVCYGNLTTETATDATTHREIYVDYHGTTMHTTK